MKLESPLKEIYSKDNKTILEAQRAAQEIAFAPIAFQASRMMLKLGVFQALKDNPDGLTVEQVSKKADISKYAAKVLDHRLAITDSEIERLRRRVQQSIEHIDQMSAQYHESINKKPEEKKAEVKSKEDEILENTYNSMYDFE